MNRNLKALGCAFAVAIVASALSAAAAQAAVGEFHISGSPTVVKGQATESKFTAVEGLLVKCGNTTLEGQPAIKTTFDLTLTPLFEGCKLGGNPMEVRPNGCKYTLTGTATLTAQLGITGCTSGKGIELIASFCTYSFPEQTNKAHVVFENKNPGAGKEDEANTKDLEATFTVAKMTYVESSGVFCPSLGKEHTDGTFSSKMTLRAFLLPEEKKVTRQGHEYTEYVGGTRSASS